MVQPTLLLGRYARPFTRGAVRKAMRRAKRARAAGDWRMVASHYADALRADPRLPLLWNKLAFAQKRLGELAASEASYRHSLALDDRWARTHLGLGLVLKLQGRIAEAADSFLKSMRSDPAVSSARDELLAFGYDDVAVWVAMQTGSLPGAPPFATLEKAQAAVAVRDWQTAAGCYADLLKAQPRRAALWVQLGHAQKENGDLAAAEASYRRSLALEPQTADTHLQLGHALKLQGRVTEAASSYIEALRLDPTEVLAQAELLAFGYDTLVIEAARSSGSLDFPPAAVSLAEADRARAARDWPAAVENYKRALLAQPQWAAIWVQLGHAHKESGDLAASEASYRRSLAFEPQTADTHLQLGHVLKLQGRIAEAATSYFDAVKLSPKAVDGMWARKELIGIGYANRSVSEALRSGDLVWPPPRDDEPPFEPPRILSEIAPPPFTSSEGNGPADLFRRRVRLPPGETDIFVDVQTVSSPAVPEIHVEVTDANGRLPVYRIPNRHGPHIATFGCRADVATEVELVLRGKLPPDSLIRRIEVGSAAERGSWVNPCRGPAMIDLPCDHIRNLIIGTTGVCNASCIHCPTNKLLPSARWTSDMSMPLFDSLVDQILANEMFITGYISLGLFGDGLVDRHVVERAGRLRSVFPYASLHVNTNGAAYNPNRHAALGSIVDTVAIHIETLDEEKYARIMEPLKLTNVLPKIRQLIRDMPAVATIASPVHRDNIDELPSLREYFGTHGMQDMIFTCMSNRCSRDDVFQELAIGPTSGSCAEEIITDLIVDWDGLVLVCCNDFLRQEPIGSLSQDTLFDILRGPKRRRVLDALRTGAWEEIDTCRTCKFSAPPI